MVLGGCRSFLLLVTTVETVNLPLSGTSCNFWDERNNNYHNRVGIGLHYKTHILWNKGNIQNSARSIVHYSIEKDN